MNEVFVECKEIKPRRSSLCSISLFGVFQDTFSLKKTGTGDLSSRMIISFSISLQVNSDSPFLFLKKALRDIPSFSQISLMLSPDLSIASSKSSQSNRIPPFRFVVSFRTLLYYHKFFLCQYFFVSFLKLFSRKVLQIRNKRSIIMLSNIKGGLYE